MWVDSARNINLMTAYKRARREFRPEWYAEKPLVWNYENFVNGKSMKRKGAAKIVEEVQKKTITDFIEKIAWKILCK